LDHRTQMNLPIQRPLKAPTTPILDFVSLQPLLDQYEFLYASDKEDGIRCLIHPVHGVCSQTMKPIPNDWVRACLDDPDLVGLDGELVALTAEGADANFNDTQSAIMSYAGRPKFEYRVFDCFKNIYDPFRERSWMASDMVTDSDCDEHVKLLPQKICSSVNNIEQAEVSALKRGKEGIMLRQPKGYYKEGRSTLNEGYLLKVKRFMDDEARVIGVEEEMENCNPAIRDAHGLQKRSKHAAGLKGKGMVGKLICKCRYATIKVASGMTEMEKVIWWENPNLIIGKTITFKYQAHGMKDLPRTPIFKGIRHD